MNEESARFNKVFQQLEAEFDVKSWRCGGIPVWPLVKFFLAREIDDYVSGKNLVHLTRGFRAGERLRYAAKIAGDRLTNNGIRPGKADIALLTYNSFRHYELGGRWFNIIQDPLQFFAQESGLSVETLEILNIFPPREPPCSRTFSITVDTVLAKLTARMGWAPNLRQSELKELHAKIRPAESIIDVGDLASFFSRLDAAIRNLFTLARLFERKITQISPRQVWMANYYSLSGMAMCLAATRLGVPSVDVSHGSSGELHYAYSGFEGHPRGGYPMVPNYFLSRHVGDAKALKSLTAGSVVHHSPVVIGDMAAHAWRANAFDIATETRAKLTSATGTKGSDSKKLDVLIAAQTIEQLPPQLVEAMKAARNWCRFWVRFHPIYLQNINEFRPPEGLEIPDLVATTTLPLFSLLERIDVVVTESSSVAEDGLSWNLPAIVVHPFGQAMFQRYIDEGRMMAASTSDSIVAALSSLRTMKAAGAKLSSDSSEAASQKAALMSFLEHVKNYP